MKVLVTGATGFVGGHLVKALRQQNIEVRALVRRTSKVAELEALDVELFQGDLTRPDTIGGVCDGVDAVLHSACAVAGTFDAGRDASARFLEVNRDGSVAIAREVLKHPSLRMVHVSSTAAMGAPVENRVDEQSSCNPKSPYQVSKREAELALLGLHRSQGLNVVILRPCVVAGEGKVNGELLKLFKLVQHGVLPYIGSNYALEKPMIMIDDLISAIILGIDHGEGGQVYLIHSDGGHTMGEIIATAGRLTGAKRTHISVPVPMARAAAFAFHLLNTVARDWNPPLTQERIDLFLADRHIDITKAREGLGFRPAHQDLTEMLGRTYRWYQQQGMI